MERKQKSPTLQWNGNNRVRLCSGKETKESDSTVEGNNKVRLPGGKETTESDYAGGKEKTKSNSKVEHDMTTQSISA